MRFALSTNWNAQRHESGEALVDEILGLGFQTLELGYHTTDELAAGILRRVKEGAVAVDSVHAFCPVPIGAPHGYPELHLLASRDEDERAMASILIGRTLTFAQSMGAKAVVLHAGRVFLDSFFGDVGTGRLLRVLDDEEGVDSPAYQRALDRALRRRRSRVPRYFDGFCLSLDVLLPKFEKAGVALCLENLPSIEAFPDEQEMLMLKQRFPTSALACWHDMGHGQVRENMGWIRHVDAARLLAPCVRGVHIHDARPIIEDHLIPGKGEIDFGAFAFFGADEVIKVFEPQPNAKGPDLTAAIRYVEAAWTGGVGVTATA